jgi:hypothetical protein
VETNKGDIMQNQKIMTISAFFEKNNVFESLKKISWKGVQTRFPQFAEIQKRNDYGEYLDCASEDETFEEYSREIASYNKWFTHPKYKNLLFLDYSDGFSGGMFLYVPGCNSVIEI